jgi:hypothetical protein
MHVIPEYLRKGNEIVQTTTISAKLVYENKSSKKIQ